MNIVLWLLAIPLVLLTITGFGLSFYLTRRQPRSSFHSPNEYGLEFEEVRFKAADGVQLQGCWIPHPGSNRAVIILHGHGGSLDWDIHRAPFLHAAGFNVFLFDFRAHGRSEGCKATFGYLERQDVIGAVDLLKKYGMKRIGLLGFSYGGIAAMLAAPICPEVNAVITDGGPVRMRTAIAARGMELQFARWLAVPLAWLTIAITSLRLGVNLFRYEPVRWVGRISPRPILFIHGDLDSYCSDFDDLVAAAGEPREVWRLPGVHHTKASEVAPKEFQQHVLKFFNSYL